MEERNIALRYRAKAKVYDVMTFGFGALMVKFAQMNVGLAVIVMLVCAYLFVELTKADYLSANNRLPVKFIWSESCQ